MSEAFEFVLRVFGVEPLVGFVDESFLRLDPCRRRVLGTRVVVYDGVRRGVSVFGFLCLGGRDVVMVSERARVCDMVSFLEVVRGLNGSRPLVVVLDNARVHHARVVCERARELGVVFVYLPPYSPDLNPIEFGWRDLKRELSRFLGFDEMVGSCVSVGLRLFGERKFSYTNRWVEKFVKAKS